MNSNGEWICLDQKVNNSELEGKYKCASWPIENNESYYGQFRIRMTDMDSDDEYFLCCSGFEIYGKVKNSEVCILQHHVMFVPVRLNHDNDRLGSNK